MHSESFLRLLHMNHVDHLWPWFCKCCQMLFLLHQRLYQNFWRRLQSRCWTCSSSFSWPKNDRRIFRKGLKLFSREKNYLLGQMLKIWIDSKETKISNKKRQNGRDYWRGTAACADWWIEKYPHLENFQIKVDSNYHN